MKAIVVSHVGAGYSVAIPGEALRYKQNALAEAAVVTQVTNPQEQQIAIDRAGRLKGISQQVEALRAQIKKPFWDAGVAIDAKAKEFRKELDERTKEIERMLSDYEAAERAKAEAARQEEERKKREAAEALRREQERLAEAERKRIATEQAAAAAEQRRIQAELDAAEASTKKQKAEAAAAQAKADQERQVAEAAAKQARREQEQAEIDAAEAQDVVAETTAISFEVEPPKAAGVTRRERATFEVTDIEAFAKWNYDRRAAARELGREVPDFIKMEIKKSVFGEYINIASDAELDSIPGVVITRSIKASTKAIPVT